MKLPKALAVVCLVLFAGLSLAIAIPREGVASLLDLTGDRIPAPPELRLLSPSDGEGVGELVVFAGQAIGTASDIIDVQYRVDQGRWTSIVDAPRGLRSVPFSLSLQLGPGDHTLEARAWDGDAFSLPARVDVRRDAPTISILAPADGGAFADPHVLVTGTIRGPQAHRVAVEANGSAYQTTPKPDGSWQIELDLPEGIHTIRARALGRVQSLPDTARVAIGEPTPPVITILTPQPSSSYGEAGDLACGGGCILFTGSSERADRIRVEVDGLPAGNATMLPTGAWSYRLPVLSLASGAHEARFLADRGVTQSLRFLARTPHALDIRGDTDPALTLTPLAFELLGEQAATATWTMNGVTLDQGAHASVALRTPGDHTLSVQTVAPNGRASTASLSLYAINRAPQVAFHGAPAMVGADIRLAADASDRDGAITLYEWELGDGNATTTSAPELVHRYVKRGLYTANLTVTDDHGATSRVSTRVLVANVAPLADFNWTPGIPSIRDVVTFRDRSADLDGILTLRSWMFDDGNTSDNATPSLRFRARGDHAVTLRVIDDVGTESVVTKIVHVANIPPEARIDVRPAIARTHEEVLLGDVSLDPDGPIVHRQWDFGDNSTENVTTAATLHTYRAPGNYTVRLTVIDDLGGVANTTFDLLVLDSEPVVSTVVTDPPEPRAHDEVTLRVVATDRDGSIVGAMWEFGDGQSSNATEPVHRYTRSGHYLGKVTVFDEGGLSVTFPFSLRILNALPSATLHLGDGGVAAFPTILLADATDIDGRIALYRFDADGDGAADCETTEPRCAFTYEMPGTYGARVWVEDDESAIAEAQLALDILTPPSDLAPPRVTIESPFAGTRLRGDQLFRGDVSGVRPVDKVEFQIRNETWAFSGAKEPWRVANGDRTWGALVDTRGFPDGAFELVVRATDQGGGVGYARIPIIVENGARASDVTLQLLNVPTDLTQDEMIRGSAFHPQGVTSVRWRIDDAPWHYVSESPLAFTIPLDPDEIMPGAHTLHVEAYRGATERAAIERTFTVPGIAPALLIDTPPAAKAYALIHAAGRIHGEGRAEWRIDHDVWRALPPGRTWNLTRDTLDLTNGTHKLELRAASHDGRLLSSTSTYPIEIINPPFDPANDERDPEPAPKLVPTAPWLALLAGAVAVATRRRA